MANNGNWRTAERWARLLREIGYRVIVQAEWRGETADLLLALHARRSFASIETWARTYPNKPLIVVLTGTDLYKDLPQDTDTQQALDYAHALIVLQDDALRYLPARHRRKTQVVYQSARSLKSPVKTRDRLNCVLVGHLRQEKDPLTAMTAWQFIPDGVPIRLLHIGAALDEGLALAASALAEREKRYRWVGAWPHSKTRQAIKQAHLLINSSRMEGGANVIVEALTAGTPVIASRISGNIGMLGKKYPGYFALGDSAALAKLLLRVRQDARFYRSLCAAARARARYFTPQREQRSLHKLIRGLLSNPL